MFGGESLGLATWRHGTMAAVGEQLLRKPSAGRWTLCEAALSDSSKQRSLVSASVSNRAKPELGSHALPGVQAEPANNLGRFRTFTAADASLLLYLNRRTNRKHS